MKKYFDSVLNCWLLARFARATNFSVHHSIFKDILEQNQHFASMLHGWLSARVARTASAIYMPRKFPANTLGSFATATLLTS